LKISLRGIENITAEEYIKHFEESTYIRYLNDIKIFTPRIRLRFGGLYKINITYIKFE
jgi:hypothetical protein